MNATSIYGFSCNTINGDHLCLDSYRDKVVLIVNTASKCGLTPQYQGLEALYKKYQERGLVILGFPCNQFARQEPAGEAQIAEFCELNYGVSFPIFAKIDVNGGNTDPLFRYLKAQAPGMLGTQMVKWNFTKFLVGRDGQVIARFAPAMEPNKLESAIESALDKADIVQAGV